MKLRNFVGEGGSSMKRDRRNKRERYTDLVQSIEAILADQTDPIVWMSTLACLIKEAFDFLWVGFYLSGKEGLSIGPYQGSLGCLKIPTGRGVCGECANLRQTILVSDVHEFPGHISCDENSRSEIVVPVFDEENQLKAVLDVDSAELEQFDELDKQFLEEITGKMRSLAWSRIT